MAFVIIARCKEKLSFKANRMNRILFTSILMAISFGGFSQRPDTLIKKLDSLGRQADSANGQKNNTSQSAYNENTKLTFASYFILLGSNIKQEFTKPFHMTRRDWGKFAAFGGAIGALMLADEPIQREALVFKNQNPNAAKISRIISNSGGPTEFIGLTSIGIYSFLAKNVKLQTTTLLASQAYITGMLVEGTIKFLSGRTRPSYYDPSGEAEPTFKGPFGNTSHDFNGDRSNSSFPSGHATVAFAAATVYSMEYRKTIWVPIVAYSAASLISLSRITENKHWTTDVLVGAMLGYLTGRHIVDNYHRYAKLKAPRMPKNSVSFKMDYWHGQYRPGLVYHIRS